MKNQHFDVSPPYNPVQPSATLVFGGLEPHIAEAPLLYVVQMVAPVREMRMPLDAVTVGRRYSS